ncbi:hypothetical protein GCM10009760_26920 [Kitasatospora kazusensis]|uniref:Gram-positive cocci surface proteins LPxTG domain-containing protein n=1 Tax=Kitasatospora kazusensis TaxID=407974 RepID=A0ABN2ZH04_9ACTN
MHRSTGIVRVLALALALLVPAAGPALAAGPAAPRAGGPVLTLGKTVEGAPDPLLPGSAFAYRLTLSCSSLSVSCLNAVAEDVLPPEFDVTDLPKSSATQTVTYDAATRRLRIQFKQPLASPPNPAGSVGLAAGTTADVSIAMRVPPTGPLKDGDSVTNTATAAADNASQVIASVTQTVRIPKDVDAAATKSWAPGSDVALSDGVSTVTLGVRNTSNGTAVIPEVQVEDSSRDTFDHFDLADVGPVTRFPAGADRVTVLVCTKPIGSPCKDSELIAGTATAGPALTLPDGVSAGQVTGVRFEFTDAAGGALPFDNTGGSVQFKLKLRDTVRSTGAELSPAQRRTVRNCALPGVVSGKYTIVGVDACADHDILPNIATVDLGKQYFPDADGTFGQNGRVVLGEKSPVSAVVTARNTSPFPVSTMTITEPSDSASSEFEKLDVSTLKVDFPPGATNATLTVTCRDGSTPAPVTLTPPPVSRTLPAGCPAGSPPKRISVTFRGESGGVGTIAQGATGRLGVHGTLNAKVDAGDLRDGVTDCADGSTGSPVNGAGSTAGTACATVRVEERKEDGRGVKSASQSEIPPGQPVTYTLGLVNDGNVLLPNVLISDPPDPKAAGNAFDSLRITAVSFGASPQTLPLALQLYDPSTGGWVTYVNGDNALLARAKGVRLLAPDGLPVGATMRADITVQLRAGVTSGKLKNCFSTSIGGKQTATPTCSQDVTVGPARSGASLQKTLSPTSVTRPVTGLAPQPVAVRLTALNTGNLSLSRLVVTDTDPAFFDAVDLVRLDGVTFPRGADRVRVDVCTTGCTATPPVFVDGTVSASTTPGLPAGIAAADVQGVRVTFSSSSGGYDLVPATGPPGGGSCPNSSVCLTVRPRTGLRSAPATPIPATIPDTASGAGESRLQTPGGTFPIPPSTATLTVTQGTTRLKVEKSPAQTVLGPGTPAPFTLNITDTGSDRLTDLVVVDEVPNGLRFDDTYNGGAGMPYRIDYQLPAGATKPADVRFEPVRDATGRITKLVWRFPGWTMFPTAQVAITYQVKLVGGVAAGTRIPNVFGAGSETQGGLVCDPSSPRLGQVTDDPRYGPGTFCTSSAEVTTRSGVAFDAAKWVAGDPGLGFREVNTGTAVPIGDPRCPTLAVAGVTYTRYPCIALVRPGQRFSYHLRIENTGTEPASSLRLLDVLPAPRDTGVLLGGDQRGTEWDTVPRLVGAAVYTGTGTAALTYSTVTNPCGRQVPTPARACNPASWDAAATPKATALEARVDFPAGFAPGTTVSIGMTLDAPPDLTRPGYPSVAWNSFAHSETVTTGGKQVVLPVTEPPKAGVGLVFGNLRILKDVQDPPAGVPVGPFTAAYSCALTAADGSTTTVRTGSGEFGAARPLELAGVPAGAVCRIWETDPAGARSDHLGEDNAIVLTVDPAPDATTAQTGTVTNHFPRRDLLIVKRVTGMAAHEVGTGPFTIRVDCTFRGTRLPDYPQDLVFAGDGAQSLTDLPEGSLCDVTEPGTGGASKVTIEATSTSRVVVDYTVPGNDLPVPGPPTPGGTATAIVTNEFATGSLRITKQLTGPGAEHADRPFRFGVLCDFDGRPGVVARALELRAPKLEGVLTDLPVGAVCTVTETDNGGADGTPPPVGRVVITEGENNVATASLDNTFSVGSLALHKQLTGPGAELPALRAASFGLHVICRREGADSEGNPRLVTVLDRTYQVTGGQTLQVPVPLPIGTRCWAAEPDPRGASSTVIDHPDAGQAAVVTLDTPAITITAVNDYRAGWLRLAKTVTGTGTPAHDFRLELTCDLPGTPPLSLVDHRPYVLTAGQVLEVTDLGAALPATARCYVTEPDHAGATSVTIEHGDAAHALPLNPTDPTQLTVVNDYTPAVVPPRPPVPVRPLPATGADPLPALLASALALALGLLLRLRTRRR